MSQSKKSKARQGRPLVWAEIDLGALRRNLKAIRASLKHPGVEVMAVVKADAYGHGMKAVARELYRGGVRFFGVATVDEAVELRRLIPTARILVLGSVCPDRAHDYARHRILPTLSSSEDADVIADSGRGEIPVHVKVDTGMGRLGVWHEESAALFKKVLSRKNLRIEGVYTHFSSADKRDAAFTRRQVELFNRAVDALRGLGVRPKHLHAANSMGVMRFKNAHLNLVRPGLILYGLNPSSEVPLSAALEPVLTLKTRIAFLKDVGPGRTLSYGATHTTRRRTKIATLPVGYSHGYRVGFSNRAFVLIHGRPCPVVGRVTMDQTLVDVGKLRSVRRWDEVTLIGRSGRAEISAQTLASLAGTIPYEIVCSVHSRIPRIYRHMR